MKVRDTRAADLDEVARLHAAAFAGEIGPIVGRAYLKAFLGWFLEAPGAISLVAEVDERIVGYVFGAPDGYGPGLTRTLMPVIAAGVLRNLPRVLLHPSFRRQVRSRLANLVLRREPKSVIFESTPPGCFCLVGIGTAPAARGQGIGKMLVSALCERAYGRSVILDVFKDNKTARSVYVWCGFVALVEEGRVVRMIRQPAVSEKQAL